MSEEAAGEAEAPVVDEARLKQLEDIGAGKSTWAETMGITRTEAYGMAHAAQRFLDLGQTDRARNIVEGLVVLNPHDAYFHAFLGALKGQKGDEDGALECYSNAIRLDDKNLAAVLNRAELYLGKGELEPAIADLARATKLDPTGSTPLGKRAISLARATATALQEASGGPRPKKAQKEPEPEPAKGGFLKGLFGKGR